MRFKKMAIYMLKTLLRLASLLIAISILSFILVSLSPIDPVQSYIGADMTRVSPDQRENIAEYWGLNESKVQQFMSWGKSIVQGDLGTSLLYSCKVEIGRASCREIVEMWVW